jgi:hypothetical protein
VRETDIWFVNNCMDEHNHDLTKPEHSHILRSHRRLSVPQKVEAVELALGGLRESNNGCHGEEPQWWSRMHWILNA